jgi:hypothetical protein
LFCALRQERTDRNCFILKTGKATEKNCFNNTGQISSKFEERIKNSEVRIGLDEGQYGCHSIFWRSMAKNDLPSPCILQKTSPPFSGAMRQVPDAAGLLKKTRKHFDAIFSTGDQEHHGRCHTKGLKHPLFSIRIGE